MEKVIGQHLLIGISGLGLTESEKKFIVQNNIAGVILFPRNLSEPKQIHALCSELQSLRHRMPDKAPLFIGIDMEGGRVARLQSPFTEWPALQKLGQLDAPTVSFHFANEMGKELNAVGINLNFAPCVDVLSNSQNTLIGDRSLGHDPELVAKHASALIRGFMKADILTCAKHFPGHGNTLEDSHQELPVEDSDQARLQACGLIPFKKSFKSRVDMTMTTHILFPKIDPQWPVTLSEIFLKKMIRDDFRYRGLIVTDDLDMPAISKNYNRDKVAVRALQAGNDLLLYCHDSESPDRAIQNIAKAVADGDLKKADLELSYQRILDSKKNKILRPDPKSFSEVEELIGHADHKDLALAIVQGDIPKRVLHSKE